MRKALIFGATGALGRDVTTAYTRQNWQVFAVDQHRVQPDIASLGSASLSLEWSLQKMQDTVMAEIGDHKFDAVINVAGGWAGGKVSDRDCAANTELMLRQSVFSSIVAGHVATTAGTQQVLLVLTGSFASMFPTPGMVGYGLAKAAVHHLVGSIAESMPKSDSNRSSSVIGILPVTINTPGNRAAMPDSDHNSWTPTDFISTELLNWSNFIERPPNGSLISWHTKEGVTTPRFESVFAKRSA
jgi:dihydropteridine reductase